MLIPRDYQEQSVEDLWQWFHRHPEGNPVMSMCVGAGKSLIIAMIIQRALREFPSTRVIVIAHQKELISQNLEKLLTIWPEADVGVYSAALGKKELGHRITYATIGSIYKDARLLGETHLILCDECHLINTKEAGTWRSFISDMKRLGNPGIRTIGLTGTPFRNGGVWITAGDDPLFHGIAANVPMRQLLDKGFLVPLKSAGVRTTISAEGVAIVNGDYKISELAARADREDLISSACDELIDLAEARKRWLVFCVTVEHANHVRDALRERGVIAETVSGETPKAEREALLDRFRRGEIRALCNCAVLTTGIDIPSIDCIALLRNTKSPTLYVQICGRGMRLSPGKTDCLFADFTDTCATLGPIDLITGRGPKRKMASEAPVKLCETCGSINSVSARVCVDCGAPFDIAESDPHGVRASAAAIMSGQTTLTRYTIDRVTYAKHQKPGRPSSLRVEYWHGLRVVAKEWVGIESDSPYGRGRAVNWWKARFPYWFWSIGKDRPWWDEPDNPIYDNFKYERYPETIEEALKCINESVSAKGEDNCHSTPSAIIINETSKYPEIISYEWEESHEPRNP